MCSAGGPRAYLWVGSRARSPASWARSRLPSLRTTRDDGAGGFFGAARAEDDSERATRRTEDPLPRSRSRIRCRRSHCPSLRRSSCCPSFRCWRIRLRSWRCPRSCCPRTRCRSFAARAFAGGAAFAAGGGFRDSFGADSPLPVELLLVLVRFVPELEELALVWPGKALAAASASTPVRRTLPAISQRLMRLQPQQGGVPWCGWCGCASVSNLLVVVAQVARSARARTRES